nr:integrase, catalytic region, zinc finger, CCHC-type, peptidase aspartic, catalytic [Tanacetum cinerariifolium]
MFDEYLNHSPCVDPQIPAISAPKPVVSIGTPSSTTIDQNSPSSSTSQTTPETPPLIIPLGVKEANHDIEVAHIDNNPFVEFSIPETSYEESYTQMSRDVLTVGSTMRIPLLYRGEYSQWVESVYFWTSSTEQPPLKDKSMWSDQEKKIQKIVRLARSLLIQGLPNDIYSLIDSNKTAKDLWDVLATHMLGFEYGEQDRKAAVLYEYETFKATEGELLLDTYIRYLQVINDLKKCGYSKDNCELNFKFLNILQPEWKQYATMMRQNKNLININIDALYNILKQNQGDVNEALRYKKKAIVVTSDPLALVVEKTKVSKRKEKVEVQTEYEGSDDEDISDLKKITALLAKAFNRKKYYAKPTNNNLRTSSASSSANKKPEYVKSVEKKEDKKADEKKRDMSKVKCYNCKKEGHFAKDCKKAKVKDYNYYKTKMLLAKKESDEQVLLAEEQDQAWMESSSDSDQEINANMFFMAQIEKVLLDSDKSSSSAEETIVEKRIEKANQQNKDFENQNKDLQDKYDVLKNQATTFEMNNKELNEQLKVLIEKNVDLLAQMNVLKDQLQVKHVVIDTHVEWCTLMFLTHSDEALEIEKFKRARENKIEFVYDYGSLNASYVNEKINFSDDYFQEIINPDFEKIDSMFQQTSSLKPYVLTVILEKIIIDLEDEVVSLLEKEKANLKTIESLKSKDVEKQICLWIIDSGCSKHMMVNHALLTNFVEKFLGTVRFGNNDFTVFVGYGDVIIGSMTIKKVYYVEGLGHNLFSVGQFCDKGLEVAFRKSTYFVRNDDGVDLLTGDRSSNLYTISLNEVASNSSTCLLAKASSSSQSWLWHQRLSHLNFATINNLVKNNIVQGLPKIKFKKDHLCTACEQGKIHQKHHKSKTAFASNKPLYLLHMDLCGPMHVKTQGKWDIGVFVGYSKESTAFRIYDKRTRKIHESMNVNFDEISEVASKQFILEPSLSNLNETRKSSNPSVSQVSETSKKDLEDLFQKFYDEYFDYSKIMKSSTTNVETSNDEIPSNEEEVFHESFESFQEGSSSSSLNDDVLQSLEEVTVPSSNTQSISNNMVPNVDEASTSHNVFNKRLDDAYFDASTSFHDPFIEPANVAEALRDADWVSAMQEELDQFARLKVWRLVLRPEGKTIIKTKWIFKNKKDESSLVIQNKARLVAVGYSQ